LAVAKYIESHKLEGAAIIAGRGAIPKELPYGKVVRPISVFIIPAYCLGDVIPVEDEFIDRVLRLLPCRGKYFGLEGQGDQRALSVGPLIERDAVRLIGEYPE
jgi:hypothetical protein